MKLSFCTNVFPLETIPAACVRLKELGYDGVELWHQYLVSRPVEQIRREIVDIGLEVTQLCPYFNVTGSREELQATYALARTYLSFAQELCCDKIRVFTGSVGASVATPEQFSQGVEGLRTLCDMAPRLQFVLEMHRGSLMESVESTRRLLDSVGRDNLKVNLQIPIRCGEGDPYAAATALAPYTTHLHAHNWSGNTDHLVCLQDGEVDYVRFLGILQEGGFDGTVSIEHADHLRGDDPLETAAKEAAYWSILKRGRVE